MATARKHVVQPPPPPEPDYTVTLELSRAEAEELRTLLGDSKCDTGAARGVWDALFDAGVERSSSRTKYNITLEEPR